MSRPPRSAESIAAITAELAAGSKPAAISAKLAVPLSSVHAIAQQLRAAGQLPPVSTGRARRSAGNIAAIEAELIAGETNESVAARLHTSKSAVCEIARRLAAEGKIALRSRGHVLSKRRGGRGKAGLPADPSVDGQQIAPQGIDKDDLADDALVDAVVDHLQRGDDAPPRPRPALPIAQSDWMRPLTRFELMTGRSSRQ